MVSVRNSILILKSILTKRNPFYVQFALSKNCQLRCKMCRAVESRKEERELSLEEIERLAGVLARMGTVFLVITGGEPLLRNDLAEVVRIFTRNKISLRLQTNGIGISEAKIKALTEAGLRDVTISLVSLSARKQDFITGRDGSWNEVMRAIALFSQYLPVEKSLCGVNIVDSKLNLDEITKLVRFVSEFGFYASLIPVHLAEEPGDYIVRGNNDLFAFGESDYPLIDLVYRELREMKKNGIRIYNSLRYLKESPYFLKYKKTYWRCDSPNLYFSISPSGGFLPCVDIKMDEPMLQAGDFVRRYHSAEFRKKVRSVVSSCPGCMYACWPEVSYLASDVRVFFSRIRDGLRVRLERRKPVSFDELIALAERFKN
ncbi:MAG: radical SAM protein [Candidatus Omnitrophota bacterium]|nr:radical SAM protein [Candidatus Omnitrophota bacterium]